MPEKQEQNNNTNILLQKEISTIQSNPYTKIASHILNIKKLLEKGANINTTDTNGDTLLHKLVSSPTIQAYNSYIKHNLTVNPVEKTKYLLDLSSILSTYLPNPFITNKKGETALSLAQKQNKKTDEKILIAYENAYLSFLNEKQICQIEKNKTSLLILSALQTKSSRQKN